MYSPQELYYTYFWLIGMFSLEPIISKYIKKIKVLCLISKISFTNLSINKQSIFFLKCSKLIHNRE